MRTLNDYFVSGRVTDISTAGSTFVAVPDGEGLGVVYDWSYINKNKTQFEHFEI